MYQPIRRVDVPRSILHRNLAVLILISTVSTSLAIIAFFNSIQTTQHIRQIASEDISNRARDESYDLSRIVVNRINSVTTNLEVLANGPSIQSENRQDVGQLFDAAQYSTDDLTEYYMWLDTDGQIASASNIARASYQFNSMWKSEKPPFLTVPQETANIYYSRIIHSPTDNADRLYVSYPIIYSLQRDESLLGEFRGVIVAAIRLDTLGSILTSELSPTFDSDVTLADVSGEIVYAVDSLIVGQNILENPAYITSPVLTELDEQVGGEIAEFLRLANDRQQPAIKNFGVSGKTYTIASHPVIENGKHFWTLYVTAPQVFTESVDALLAQQDAFVMITLLVIGSVSVGSAFLVSSWNRRLEATVKARTIELDQSNVSLVESNRQLASANEQLKVHADLQREFINIAAHELRTPIMPILGMSDLLESRFRQEKTDTINLRRGDFEIISRNSRRLERLAVDILDVSRIETRSLVLHIDSFDLLDLVQHTVSDIKNLFPKAGIEYQVDVEKGIALRADKSKMGQVLWNLVHNATKFTDGVLSFSSSFIKCIFAFGKLGSR